jgi:hypothetical protein
MGILGFGLFQEGVAVNYLTSIQKAEQENGGGDEGEANE